jgi:hypothetical protein
MFTNATKFNQDLSKWNVKSFISADQMFTGSGMTTANIDKLLATWSTQPVINNVPLGLTSYSVRSQNAVSVLTSSYGWRIAGAQVNYSMVCPSMSNLTYTYVNTGFIPVAGRAYSLYGILGQPALATYTAQSGDASYIFQNVASIPVGVKTLTIVDNVTTKAVDGVIFDTSAVICSYVTPSPSTSVGIYLGGTGQVFVNWGDGSFNTIGSTAAMTTMAETAAAIRKCHS